MTRSTTKTTKRADSKGKKTAQGRTPAKLPVAMTGRASAAKAAEGDEPVFAYIASLPQPQRGATVSRISPRRGSRCRPLSAPIASRPVRTAGPCLPTWDCAAETTILSHFVEPSVGGPNAKATQTSGMTAARQGVYLGIGGVKFLSEMTAQSTTILGGSQFNTSFSVTPVQEGCTSHFPPVPERPECVCATDSCIPVSCIPAACITGAIPAKDTEFGQVPGDDLISPEQALYNVLHQYFDGTAVGGLYGGTQGNAPLNYLQVYSVDVTYATSNATAPVTIVVAGGGTTTTSAQEELDSASMQLLGIAEP
jgi:hypothetical protein